MVGYGWLLADPRGRIIAREPRQRTTRGEALRPEDRKLLRATALFAPLTAPQFERVSAGIVVHGLPRGALVCHQGERAEFVYLILDGRVALLGEATGKPETVVEFFEAGDVFIAAAAILDQPLLMSARVVRDARIALLPAGEFRKLLAEEPTLTLALVHQLARYWRKLIRQIKDLKLKSAAERLAVFLLALAPGASGAASVTLPQERKLLAAHIGITPESLSRAFVQLRAIGVGGRGRKVTIDDIARLRAFCGADEEAMAER
jgi:CRP/FNR family transcriptional activator FtrB